MTPGIGIFVESTKYCDCCAEITSINRTVVHAVQHDV